MQRLILPFFAFLALLARAVEARAQADEPLPELAIVAPAPGDALQGVVDIRLEVGEVESISSELLFGYANDATETWFLIWEGAGPLQDGLLATWNTTTLTDGNYTLRLVADLADGSQLVVEIPGLRIRNYSPLETNTPTLTPGLQHTPTAAPPALPSETPMPGTPTPLPPNPASLTPSDLGQALLYGGLSVLSFFLLMGFYAWLRRAFRYRG